MYIWKATYDCFMGLHCRLQSDIYHYMLSVCLKNTPDNCLFTGFDVIAE